jgi:hypothetical protein
MCDSLGAFTINVLDSMVGGVVKAPFGGNGESIHERDWHHCKVEGTS